jgi:hypothetical protein
MEIVTSKQAGKSKDVPKESLSHAMQILVTLVLLSGGLASLPRLGDYKLTMGQVGKQQCNAMYTSD